MSKKKPCQICGKLDSFWGYSHQDCLDKWLAKKFNMTVEEYRKWSAEQEKETRQAGEWK